MSVTICHKLTNKVDHLNSEVKEGSESIDRYLQFDKLHAKAAKDILPLDMTLIQYL